jgi:hypothetical protein
LDKEILYYYDATIIGYIASITKNIAKINPATIIPEKFQQYCKVLGKELADKVPDHKPYNHAINLTPGKQLLWGPMYPLNETELQVL